MAVDRLDARYRVGEQRRARDLYFVDDFVWLFHWLGIALLCATIWKLSLPGLGALAFGFLALGWALFGLWWGVSALLVLAAALLRRRRPPRSDLLHLLAQLFSRWH